MQYFLPKGRHAYSVVCVSGIIRLIEGTVVAIIFVTGLEFLLSPKYF